jgi:hypothetical protein
VVSGTGLGNFIITPVSGSYAITEKKYYTWQLQTKVATVGGSLAVDGVAQTSVSGTKYFSYPTTAGDTHTIAVTPDIGYIVDKVLYEGSLTSAPYPNVTYDPADAVKTVLVYFKKQTFNLTTSAGNGGSVSPVGTTLTQVGTAKVVTFLPNTGKRVQSVTVAGVTPTYWTDATGGTTVTLPGALNQKVYARFNMPANVVTLTGVYGP